MRVYIHYFQKVRWGKKKKRGEGLQQERESERVCIILLCCWSKYDDEGSNVAEGAARTGNVC